MIFERGDLLLIPFPFTDLSATKRRPVIALTCPDGYGHSIALPVTSRSHHARIAAIAVADLVSGTLPAASWARTDRVVTLNASLVVKSVARVSDAFIDAAVRALCTYLSGGVPIPEGSPKPDAAGTAHERA